MNIRIIKHFDVKLDGTVKTLQAGALMDLPDDKAQRLIDAGYGEPYSDGRDLPHYCEDQDAWCSTKLPDSTTPCRKCGAISGKAIAGQAVNRTGLLDQRIGSRDKGADHENQL